MGVSVFAKGLVVGFLICTPIGPVAVLCISRTLKSGIIYGIVSGLGAATADSIFGLVAVLGLSIVSNFLVKEQIWLRLGGGLLLMYVGMRIFVSHPSQTASERNNPGYLSNGVSAFLLTLTNPLTVLAVTAIFAGLGLAGKNLSHSTVLLLVCGLFCGSALWWVALSSVTNLLRERLPYGKLQWFNRLTGVIIAGFGVFTLVSVAIWQVQPHI